MKIDKEKIMKEIKNEIKEEKYEVIKNKIKERIKEKNLCLVEIEKIEKEIELLIKGKEILEDGQVISAREWTSATVNLTS